MCRELLVVLGPCYIKAGQVLANRPDIIRQDYMDELCVLQDDVPSFPDAAAFEIIESNLGRPIEEVFSFISERPVAAASLGQVRKRLLPRAVCLHSSPSGLWPRHRSAASASAAVHCALAFAGLCR